MTVATLPIDPETLLIDADGAREYGKAAAEAYRAKKPYPYGCYDNFMPPEILDKVREELRHLPAAHGRPTKSARPGPPLRQFETKRRTKNKAVLSRRPAQPLSILARCRTPIQRPSSGLPARWLPEERAGQVEVAKQHCQIPGKRR